MGGLVGQKMGLKIGYSFWMAPYLDFAKKNNVQKSFLTFNTFVSHFYTTYQKFGDVFCDIDLF